MPNFPGEIAYTLLTDHTPLLDSGPLTKHLQTGFERGPGVVAYPLLTDRTPLVDAGPLTKHLQTGFARGGTDADYNVKLRGIQRRVDRLPPRPYP